MPYNIVFIMTDQQRYDMLSCNGTSHVNTPNLDRLAAGGMRFTQAYTTCPLCTPARAALFTGMWPSSAGYFSNQDNAYRHVRFLGEAFNDAGYAAGYSGKWHLSGQDGGYYGNGQPDGGFMPEYWYDGRNFMDEVGEEGFKRWKAGKDLEDSDCWGTRVADRAEDFIRRHKDQPFFYVASFDEPHGPSSAPERYYEMFRGTTRERVPNIDDSLEDKPFIHQYLASDYFGEKARVPPGERPNNSPRYYGCSAFIDDQVGRVVRAVDEHCAENTVIVYTVDHGDHHGSHHLLAKGVTMYDETARVSLIVRAPGITSPGAVCDNLVSHINLAPTICELAEVPALAQFGGESIVPLLANPRAEGPDAVFLEYNRFGIRHDIHCGFTPVRCVRKGPFKFSMNLYDRDELYDLGEDPFEMRNLIDDSTLADVREECQARILSWMDERQDPLRGEGWFNRSWCPDRHIDPKAGEKKLH